MSNERDRENRNQREQIHRNRIAAIFALAETLGYSTKQVGADYSQTIDSQAITETFKPAGYSTRESATEQAATANRKPMTRRAETKDWIAIAELEQLCYPADPWSMSETHGKLIQANLDPTQQSTYFHPTRFLVFANLADQPIGYVAYRIFDGYARIDRLGVHPKCRTKGVGTILLDAMIEAIAELAKLDGAADLNVIEAIVHERELPAQLFLRANGFTCHDAVVERVRRPSIWNPNEWGPWEDGDSLYSFLRILDEAGK